MPERMGMRVPFVWVQGIFLNWVLTKGIRYNIIHINQLGNI